MADPMTIALLAGSSALSAYGSLQQGEAAMAASNAEAASLRANAEIVQKNAIARDDQTRRQQRQQMGTMLAASAEAGAGLNADALRSSIYDAEMDSSTIRYEGNLRAAGLNDQASIVQWEGKQKMKAAELNAVSTLLNGSAQMASSMGGAPKTNNAFADRAGPVGSGSGGRSRTITGGR